MIEATIVKESQEKHFVENKYWENNPNSVYLGTIALRVEAVYAPTTTEHYDLALWTSGDGKSCSMVFLQCNDYTAYHSMSAYVNGTMVAQQYYHPSVEKHPISVIHRRILELAEEKGLLKGFKQ